MSSKLTKKQTKTYGPRFYTEDGTKYRITAEVRHDDSCGNGHNTFAITAEIYEQRPSGGFREYAFGCCHTQVAEHFPELRDAIKWHLTSTDGPMHYIANTVYHAGDKDHWRLRKGEKKPLLRGGQPGAFCYEWSHDGEPIKSLRDLPEPVEGREVTLVGAKKMIVGEGKPRDLDAARRCAVWPDATDEELTAEGLADRLKDRHAGLMRDFRKCVESLGLVF